MENSTGFEMICSKSLVSPDNRKIGIWSTALLSLVLFVIALSPVAAAGLDPKTPVIHYGVDFWGDAEGLPQSRVRSIIQTRDGYLWLGTAGGVVRFDGATFTVFGVQTGTLKDNEVFSLLEDDDGGLWVGTFSGGLTLIKDGRSTTFTVSDGLPDDVIRELAKDGSGNIWIRTAQKVCRYSHGTFTTFATKDGLATDFITALCADRSQGVFVAAGHAVYHFVDGKFVVLNGIIDDRDGRTDRLACGHDGSLWVGFEDQVVKKWNNGVLTTYTGENNFSPRYADIYQDADGIVWAGSRDGLYRLINGKFEHFSDDTRISSAGVSSMCADREGSLWVGLEVGGLARLRKTKVTTLTQEEGLRSDSTRTVFQDSKGAIWIGTVGGFSRLSNGVLTNYTEFGGRPIPIVTSIGEDKEGNLWIGAGGTLLVMKDGQLASPPSWRRVFDIKVVYGDPEGRMWIGTDGNGLFRFEQGNMTVFRVRDGLGSDQIRAILYDRQGAIWVATNGGGVSRYREGRFTTYTVRDGLANNRVLGIHEDENGALWFATRSGLSRFKRGRFFNYGAEAGLLASFVHGILDDGKGNFWFSGDQGIFRVSKADLNAFAEGKIRKISPISIGVKDGMKTTACVAGVQPTNCKTKEGQLLFCTLKGMVAIDPDRMFSNNLIPPVYIESVAINKKTRPLGRDARIAPGEGEVEISYTALSYLAPERVRFKYLLEGFDKEWVDAGTRRSAHYASLPPGKYRFQVIACNADGVWNTQGDSFSFDLLPHFYQTIWFYMLCGLALPVFVLAVHGLRVHQLKLREQELQRRVDETVANVKVLSGLLPICANCKKVRDDKGYWNQIESYITQHSETVVSHGICPDCMAKLYPQSNDRVLEELRAARERVWQKSS